MKKLIILSAIALSGLFYNTANAQIRIHFGINLLPHIYVRPAVAVDVQAPEPMAYNDDNAPADYDPADDYYYLPDVNAYYSVADQCYYYNDGDNWVSAAYLPGEYNNFDWRSARHFEVRAPRPYMHNDFYMNRFHGADFNWARYNAPRGGYADQQHYADYRNQQFDNRGNNQQFANRDRGGSHGQDFDNGNRDNFQNRDNNRGQQFQQMQNTQNQNRDHGNFGQPSNQNRDDNRGQQQDRVAQNNKGGYGGHTVANRRMF